MKRKDLLAAGALKQTYAGGVGEGDIFRNVAPEGTRDETVPVVEQKEVTRKTFRPLGSALLVRQTAAEDASSILITETLEKEKPCEGLVLAIGKDLTTVVVGDTVVFGKYSGQEFKLNGELLLILELNEVKGIIEDAPTVEFADGPVFGGCTNLSIGRA